MRYVWRYRWHHALLIASVLVAVAASVGARYALKFLVDAMAAGPQQMDGVWHALVLLVALICGDNVLWRVGGFAAARAFPAVGADLRLDLFRHLLGHSAGFFGERLGGALANRVNAAANAVFTVENSFAWNALPPGFAVVASLLSLVAIRWDMALALTGAVGFIAIFMAVGALRGQPLHSAYAWRAAETSGEIVDVVTNHATVRAFAAKARETDRLNTLLQAETAAHRHALLYMERLRVGHAIAVAALTGGMLVWGIELWRQGLITAGDVVVVGSFSLALLQASRDLVVAFVDMTHHWSRLADAVGGLTAPHDLPDDALARPLERCGGAVAFEQVGFAYPGGRRVLDAINLAVPKGQRVGIVGPSGAGKTTLMALLQRLYAVEEGRVLIDGQDVACLLQESLRRAIAVVPQDVVLFHRSVLENIRYGRPDASDAAVFAAARAARCDRFIHDLPEGYDTLVGERGVKLSGGQRQRIGIARAILADAPIVLLDEATSALDSESEIAVQRALAELMRGRTVLAIAHRLSTVMAFDRVIVLDDGRIVEDGAPEVLKHGGGPFGRLWRMQTGMAQRQGGAPAAWIVEPVAEREQLAAGAAD